MAEWIKLFTNIFENRKIKRIRKKENGNDMVLIWIMLLSIAGRCNDGGRLTFTDDIPYDAEMLAEELEINAELVSMALQIFIQYSMLYVEDGFYVIAGWEEYQNIEGMDRIREQTRERVAKYREKQRNVTCNVTVTQCNATEEERRIRNKNKKESKRESKGTFLDMLEDD